MAGYDFTEDETLSPFELLCKYSEDGDISSRQTVAHNILGTLRAALDDESRRQLIISRLVKLSLDNAPSVRTELIEQIPHVAMYCREHETFFPDTISTCIVPMVVRYLNDEYNQVRRASQSSLLMLVEHGLLLKGEMETEVVNVILELASPGNPDEYRADAVTLMSKVAPLVGRDITERLFLPRFCEVLVDPLFQVRKVCATHFGEFCNVVSGRCCEDRLLPKLYSLCMDGVWGVRKACAECFAAISCACCLETRHRILSKLFADLLVDQSRWVRLAAFQQLGPFIYTFAEPRATVVHVSEDGTVLQADLCESESLRVNEISRANLKHVDRKSLFRNIHLLEAIHGSVCESSHLAIHDGQADDMDNVDYHRDVCTPDGLLSDPCDTANPAAIHYDERGFFGSNTDSVNQATCQSGGLTMDDSAECDSHMGDAAKMDSQCNRTEGVSCLEQLAELTANHTSQSVLSPVPLVSLSELTANPTSQSVLSPVPLVSLSELTANPTSQSVLSPVPLVSPSEVAHVTSSCIGDSGDGDSKNALEGAEFEISDTPGVNNGDIGRFSHAERYLSFSDFLYWRQPLLNVDDNCEDVLKDPVNVHTVIKVDGEEDLNVCPTELDRHTTEYSDSLLFQADIDGGGVFTARVSTFDDNVESAQTVITDVFKNRFTANSTMDGIALGMGHSEIFNMATFAAELPSIKDEHDRLAQQQDIVPRTLLGNFLSMVEPSCAQTVDTEIAHHCAYNFPAVACTLGRSNWHCIRQLYETLSQAVQWKVRRCLAFSLHDIALVCGEDITHSDILPIFDGFLKDLDEVRIGVLKHLARFLQLLRPKIRVTYLPKLSSFMATDNQLNWRFRQELAVQLAQLCDVFEPALVAHYISPLAVRLCADKVCQVRFAAYHLCSSVLHRLDDAGDGSQFVHELCAQLVNQFSSNRVWSARQIFGQLCQTFLEEKAVDAVSFSRFLLPSFLRLASDTVPNVRLTVGCILSQHIFCDAYFLSLDRCQWEDVLTAIKTLQSDSDVDVQDFSTDSVVTWPKSPLIAACVTGESNG